MRTASTGKLRHAPPKAGAMIEALRGLGYSTATALADIIDNSISARASRVDIGFAWAEALSTVTILDDGDGMDDAELDVAMRLGQKSPLDVRSPHDLGRFGLGLKTASFSQCRRLTVASCKNGRVSCLRWDLDVLALRSDDGWYLLEGPHEHSARHLQPLEGKEHGTLVLWELNDRIVTPGFAQQDFLDLIDRVEQHLAMVFHRFLEGVQPRLALSINGRAIRPSNPFLTGHPATWSSPIVRFLTPDGAVEAQGHVLPHKDRLRASVHDEAAGPDGWTAQQGFYIYRNERLLLAGSWLGLGQGRSWTKEEAHRLARIRLDIPNTADSGWKIDVRKSTARPPVALRGQLVRLAEDVRERARRVFAHRGKAISHCDDRMISQAWRVEHFNSGIRYRIDRDHPAVRSVLEDSGSMQLQVQAMLRILEETIPVQRIWLDTAESLEIPRTGFAEESAEEIRKVLLVMYRNLVLRKGLSAERARMQLLHTEPFDACPEIVLALPDEPEENVQG